MAYDAQSTYNKFQKKSCGHSSSEGCGCKSESNPECGCCPPGLVGMYDTEGKFAGCVSPNDAQEYQEAIKKICAPGFIALYDKSTDPATFLSCVSESEFAAAYIAVNGTVHVDPVSMVLVPETEEVPEGEDIRFYPMFTPSNTTIQTVTWTSSDETKATVDSSGLVTGVAAGVTTIKATSTEDVLVFGSRILTVTP